MLIITDKVKNLNKLFGITIQALNYNALMCVGNHRRLQHFIKVVNFLFYTYPLYDNVYYLSNRDQKILLSMTYYLVDRHHYSLSGFKSNDILGRIQSVMLQHAVQSNRTVRHFGIVDHRSKLTYCLTHRAGAAFQITDTTNHRPAYLIPTRKIFSGAVLNHPRLNQVSDLVHEKRLIKYLDSQLYFQKYITTTWEENRLYENDTW